MRRGRRARPARSRNREDRRLHAAGGHAETAGHTVDVDGKGKIWVTTDCGALRVRSGQQDLHRVQVADTEVEHGTSARTYGIAADRNGNGWWVQMKIDSSSKAMRRPARPPNSAAAGRKGRERRVARTARRFYETFSPPDFNTPYAVVAGTAAASAPTRTATSSGSAIPSAARLAKININTSETTLVPLPNPDAQQPYQIAVDNDHNVWTNLWSTDQSRDTIPRRHSGRCSTCRRAAPKSRYISILERDGRVNVILPYSRTRKVAVMTVRSEADIEALRKRAPH